MTRLRDLDAAWFALERSVCAAANHPHADDYLDLLEHAVTALRHIESMPDTHALATNPMARAMYEVISNVLDAEPGRLGDRDDFDAWADPIKEILDARDRRRRMNL